VQLRVHGYLAYVGRQLGVELWPKDDTSTGIASAVDFLYRHCCSRETWPHQQIEEIDWRMVCPVFTRAAALSGTTCDLAAMGHRFPEGFSPDCFPMVEPIHPFGKLRSPRAE
jgi:hypothetical protein